MHLLLPLLFAVSILSPEPLRLPPQPTSLQILNAQYDGTNAEGWDDAMAIPDPAWQEQSSVSPVWKMGNGTSDVEQWRPLVAGQFPPEQVENALCAIRSESGGEPRVPNLQGSNARGLFQIMWTIWGDEFGFSETDFYVPELNVYAAARIWERSGWQPWSPRTRRLCNLG